jgi:hypothetical protein
MNEGMTPFWIRHRGSDLAQGDFLSACLIPTFEPTFGEQGESEMVSVSRSSLIVVTQTCDLAAAKAQFVALCPIFTLERFEQFNSKFKSKGVWEEVRKGRREGLHMLGAPEEPQNNRKALVVDFRQIHSLPFDYLSAHAAELGDRWRLQSPFLEHFSQAFARFFMRVGLPTAIPPFK